MNYEQSSPPTLRELYPELDEEEFARAEENLRRYVANAVRIYQRLERDPEAMARFRALTDPAEDGRKDGKGREVAEADDSTT